MCLILDSEAIEAKVAKKDIVCYKIVCREKKEGDIKYITPYCHNIISSGSNLSNVPVVAKFDGNEISDSNFKKGTIKTTYYDTFMIDGGAIHSFSNKKDALREMNTFFKVFLEDDCKTYFLAECIIPKGTLYYTGISGGDRHKDYASRELIYKTIIDV